jgi:hypothetical protein
MAEIAARADAKIGSLYRFFPNKDAVADAISCRSPHWCGRPGSNRHGVAPNGF